MHPQSQDNASCETHGEMAEWSNAAVLKTVEGHTSGGSNPSFSAKKTGTATFRFFYVHKRHKLAYVSEVGIKKTGHLAVQDPGFLCKVLFSWIMRNAPAFRITPAHIK